MVATLIFILAIVVFLAFFVGLNLENVCSIWFFKQYTDIPVSVLVFIAFAAGIIFSILIYFISQLRKPSSQNPTEENVREKRSSKRSGKTDFAEKMELLEKKQTEEKTRREKVKFKDRFKNKKEDSEKNAVVAPENSENGQVN